MGMARAHRRCRRWLFWCVVFLACAGSPRGEADEYWPDVADRADPSEWPVNLWCVGEEAEAGRAVELLLAPDVPCGEVHEAVRFVVSRGGLAAGLARGAVVQSIHGLAAQLEAGRDVPYAVLFGEVASSLRAAWEVVQLLSLGAMIRKDCFRSASRQILSKALLPLQAALQQQISTMWWMFDIGQYSNTNSPAKHFKAVHDALTEVEVMFAQLMSELPDVLHDTSVSWGHQDHGMFMNSTVMYRKLFPQAALVDKGLLRYLLRLLPPDITIADFGALDGHYSRWLNDTGLMTAYAFDGVQGVTELTGGAVTEVDLSGRLRIPWHPQPFDWVMCLEVAEHIPPEMQDTFLDNLNRHAAAGLVLSWATPQIEGEGHVSCLPLEESRRRVEALGFVQDVAATAALRAAAEIPWIAVSVAVYRRHPAAAAAETGGGRGSRGR
mmetsp:Transcript_169198/g.543943  ORF Transcript_169198/g.543943 Transcript_169198/m.543943 type:complete len:438 (+) Transcript_169198:126-1439(+)